MESGGSLGGRVASSVRPDRLAVGQGAQSGAVGRRGVALGVILGVVAVAVGSAYALVVPAGLPYDEP
jgi:hypothetical protein